AVAFFIVSIVLFKMMPTSLIGNIDRGETLLNVELTPGVTLADTTDATQKLMKILRARPEVTQVFATVGAPSAGRGRQSGSAGEVNKSSIYIAMTPRDKRKLSQQEFERDVRPALRTVPGARVSFTRIGGITGKLRVVLTSSDPIALDRVTSQ